jgi:hypothetical protein
MGNVVNLQTLINVFQSLDVFRDKNMTDLVLEISEIVEKTVE